MNNENKEIISIDEIDIALLKRPEFFYNDYIDETLDENGDIQAAINFNQLIHVADEHKKTIDKKCFMLNIFWDN
jgi:hypothetical protein